MEKLKAARARNEALASYNKPPSLASYNKPPSPTKGGAGKRDAARGRIHKPVFFRIWLLRRPYVVYIRTANFVFSVNRDRRS